MAFDELKQVGKYIRRTSKEANFAASRYFSKNPSYDRVRDIFSPDTPFRMTFVTKENQGTVKVSLDFNKPPPQVGCFSGDCYRSKAAQFTLTKGSHLITLEEGYIEAGFLVFVNGNEWSKYTKQDQEAGLVWVYNLPLDTNTVVICYVYLDISCEVDDSVWRDDFDRVVNANFYSWGGDWVVTNDPENVYYKTVLDVNNFYGIFTNINQHILDGGYPSPINTINGIENSVTLTLEDKFGVTEGATQVGLRFRFQVETAGFTPINEFLADQFYMNWGFSSGMRIFNFNLTGDYNYYTQNFTFDTLGGDYTNSNVVEPFNLNTWYCIEVYTEDNQTGQLRLWTGDIADRPNDPTATFTLDPAAELYFGDVLIIYYGGNYPFYPDFNEIIPFSINMDWIEVFQGEP